MKKQSTSKSALRSWFFYALTGASVFYFVAFSIAYVTRPHAPVGGVFVNTWMSGRAARLGHPTAWFDIHTYNAAVRAYFDLPHTSLLYNWSYPPHIMFFTWVVGLLPYLAAWVLWNIAGFAAYFFTSTQGENRIDRLIFIAAWPAAIGNYFAGENGFFTASMIIGGLSLLNKRPIIAGILFGFLTVKPQLGLLLPSMLLAASQWRCLAAAVITAISLAAVTLAIYGPDVWSDYFNVALTVQNQIWAHLGRPDVISMPTAYMNMRAFGATSAQAWLVQVPVSLAALAAVIWTFYKRRDPILSQSLFVTASFLATPYVFVYDMVVFGWVITKLRDHPDSNVLDDIIALGVWSLTIVSTPYPYEGITAFFVFPMILMLRLLWRLRRAPTVEVTN